MEKLINKLEKAYYIKADNAFDRQTAEKACAPMFRKKFNLNTVGNAQLILQAMGVGIFYLNGKKVTNDLFISPFSNYERTRWVNVYDVTHLIKEGENVFAVMLGNGFYNDCIETQFDFHNAPWRDCPKFVLQLYVDGKLVVQTDDSWVKNEDSFIVYNQFRSGEIFDSRKYDENWINADFDDSSWANAYIDDKTPQGRFLLDKLPPVIEASYINPVRIVKNAKGYMADFGVNIAGYVQVEFCGKAGDTITISHAEEIDENNLLKLNNLDFLYPHVDFQVEKIICSGKQLTYKPYFVYHGFRYIQIEGVEDINDVKLTAIFTHQDIKRIATFDSGSGLLNYLFNGSIVSFYSNAIGTITDCPTREKLGWTNDIQASTEQFLINYDIEPMFEKLLKEMQIEIGEDGSMPAIIPTCKGWGRHNGPVADGSLFHIPYMIYLYKGEDKYLKECIPVFYTYMGYLQDWLDNGKKYPLGDWTGCGNNENTPIDMIAAYYLMKFKYITALAEKLNGNLAGYHSLILEHIELKTAFLKSYINADGTCKIATQTALAFIIKEGLSDKIEPLKKQLIKIVKDNNYHLDCGMFGIQYIYDALSIVGADEEAFKLISLSEPGYVTWYKNGATSLWERWDGLNTYSHNHHMFSCVVSWLFKGVLGINMEKDVTAFSNVVLKPAFIKEVGYAKGSMKTVKGTIYAEWKIDGDTATYKVTIPSGVHAKYNGKKLVAGENIFKVKIN